MITMPSILFVCTANICRSPLAQGLFIIHLRDTKPDWRVESAGTWAIDGMQGAQNSLNILKEKGLDLNHHRSRIITNDLMREFNLILTMEQGQKEALQIEFPLYARKVFLLSEMIGKDYEIEDPVGRGSEDYQITAREIEFIIENGFAKILALVENNLDNA